MESFLPPELCATDMAVLVVLMHSIGRVLSRASIMRLAGIDHCGVRRCDSAIVSLRKVLGADSIVTVRQRGWMLTQTGVDRAVDLYGPSLPTSATG